MGKFSMWGSLPFSVAELWYINNETKQSSPNSLLEGQLTTFQGASIILHLTLSPQTESTVACIHLQGNSQGNKIEQNSSNVPHGLKTTCFAATSFFPSSRVKRGRCARSGQHARSRMHQRAATYLVPLQRGAHQDHRSHRRDHIIRRGVLCLQREETPSDG